MSDSNSSQDGGHVGENQEFSFVTIMQTGTPIFDRFACYGCNLSYINYQLTYSDSCSGWLNSALPLIADFSYVISMLAAFDSLLMDDYHTHILTVELYTVAI